MSNCRQPFSQSRDRSSMPAGLLGHSLRALGHPLTIGAVAALLLNDHLLKDRIPSVLTGKLSDAAGLFFFPFLLAAALGLLERALVPPGRRTTASVDQAMPTILAACAATGLAFAAVKLDPGVNRWASQSLATALGLPVRIAPDPTDLITLPILALSCLLWRRVSARPGRASLRRSLTALGLAALATMATQPCPPEQPISHLIPFDDSLYALSTWYAPPGEPPALGAAYRSADGGTSWEYVDGDELPPAVLDELDDPIELPRVACVPDLPDICYRVSGEEQVESSSDGGRTWLTTWEPEPDRRLYMERVAAGHGQLLACGKELDLRAQNLLIVGQGADHRAMVALGNEGLLLGQVGQAGWTRVPVGWAEPTPARGSLRDLWPPLVIGGETVAALLAAALVFWILSAMSWRQLAPRTPPAGEAPSRKPILVFVGVVLALLLAMGLLGVEELIPMVILPLVALTAYGVHLGNGWLRAARSAETSVGARLGGALAGGLLAGIGVWLPFALWVVGTFAPYLLAFALAVGLGGGVLAACILVLRRMAPATA